MRVASRTLSRMHTETAAAACLKAKVGRIYEVVGHASWIHPPRWASRRRFPPCYRRPVIRASLITRPEAGRRAAADWEGNPLLGTDYSCRTIYKSVSSQSRRDRLPSASAAFDYVATAAATPSRGTSLAGTLSPIFNSIFRDHRASEGARAQYPSWISRDTVRYRMPASSPVIRHGRLVSPGSGALYPKAFGSCSACPSGDLQFATPTLI